jgi:transposase-like protein
MFAAEIRERRVAHMRGYPNWRWRSDEVFVKVNGKLYYLCRAVDYEGGVLEAVVTAKRDKAAAMKLLKRITQQSGGEFAPGVSTTRAGDAAVSKYEDAAEVQLSSRPGPQPFQSGAASLTRQIYKQRRTAALAEWRALTR